MAAMTEPSAGRTTPSVSVVMPVYNEAEYVEQAIQSILRQTHTDFELVIIDNGSSDASPDILGRIRDPRVRVFRNPHNLGSAAASNRAVRESRAELIARMDADDIALPHRLERQLAAFAASPDLALVGGQVRHFEGRRPLLRCFAPRARTAGGIAWQSMFASPFFHSTVMFTRASFDAAGGYDERMQRSSDFALFSKIQMQHAVANLPDVLVGFRHLPRKLLHDAEYDSLVRSVIDRNTEHVLAIHSSDDRLRRLAKEWPEFALMLRGARTALPASERGRLPEFLSAFRTRLRELDHEQVALREIAADCDFLLCSQAWDAIRMRIPAAATLARHALVAAPMCAARFVTGQLTDAAWRRLQPSHSTPSIGSKHVR
jgi:glycosyltransferase involved in cell wall biosynthesis